MAIKTLRIPAAPAIDRDPRRAFDIRRHRLPSCPTTGLRRFRDRHQARAGAAAASTAVFRFTTFTCPDCQGFHLEPMRREAHGSASTQPTPAIRRFVVLDVENLTRGARRTRAELAALWERTTAALDLTAHDRILIGASRSVAHRYDGVIHGRNVTWVIGANAPDAADRALLGACNLHRIAAEADELVIVSGDHCFADLARRARRRGIETHVVTPAAVPGERDALSRELAAVADMRTYVWDAAA